MLYIYVIRIGYTYVKSEAYMYSVYLYGICIGYVCVSCIG